MYLCAVSPEGSVNVTSSGEVYSETDTAVLNCSHLGGPDNTIQWLRDGSVLSGETQDTYVTEGLLVAGEVFTCMVTNAAGEGIAEIVLNIAPVFSSHPRDVFRDVNQSAVFCCSVHSYPPPQYEWFKVNGSLPASVETSTNSCLTVDQVSFGDEGKYYCIGTSNNISITSDTALLTGKLATLPCLHTYMHTQNACPQMCEYTFLSYYMLTHT